MWRDVTRPRRYRGLLRVLFIGFVLLRRAALGSGLWYHSRQTPRLVTGVFGSIFSLFCSSRFTSVSNFRLFCTSTVLWKINILVKVWPQQDFVSSDGRRGLIGLSHDIGAATLGTAGYSQIPTCRARHDFHSPPTFVNPLHYTYISRRLLSSILSLDLSRTTNRAIVCFNTFSIDLILDLGPQPTIWSNIQTPEFSEKSCLALTGKRGKNQIVALLSAFSSLFEKVFSVEFSELFSQMGHQFTFTQLPTYPFQRLYNYPAYIATRDSLLGVGHHIVV